jgi:hypothetical protein
LLPDRADDAVFFLPSTLKQTPKELTDSTRNLQRQYIAMVEFMPLLHPAVPAASHLWPGIQSWANSAVESVANLSVDKVMAYDYSLKGLEVRKIAIFS